MTACFAQARQGDLLPQRPEAAVDATGLEATHASSYYVKRKGYKPFERRDWPKMTLVCETRTHLLAGAVMTRGPSNDSPQFAPAVRQAARHLRFDRLLADAAYDAEHNHRLCREELGIRSTVIPINERRANAPPSGHYRAQMARRFHRRVYGQRWQVESAISRHKRRLGSALRSRAPETQAHEGLLRVLTHNLMIL